MGKEFTELVFIIDRSGSMSGLEEDTIGGFNGLLQKQKLEAGEAYVSVVLFDDRTELLYDRVDIHKVEPMNEKQYYVRGCTALLDAVGGAIRHIENVHKYAGEDNKPSKTLFIITTDGMENASSRYSFDDVRRMVDFATEKNQWEFLFLGANIDAIRVAGRFGIKSSRVVDFENDSAGTRLNYEVMSKVVTCARMSTTAKDMKKAFDEDKLLAPIREDYKRRHGKNKGDKIDL